MRESRSRVKSSIISLCKTAKTPGRASALPGVFCYKHCTLQSVEKYAKLKAPPQRRRCQGAVCIDGGRLSSGRNVRRELLICASPDGWNVSQQDTRRRSFHHGSFEYCFFCTEPFGNSHHRCHSGDMDGLAGCLSGQTTGKALFCTQKVTTASSVQT